MAIYHPKVLYEQHFNNFIGSSGSSSIVFYRGLHMQAWAAHLLSAHESVKGACLLARIIRTLLCERRYSSVHHQCNSNTCTTYYPLEHDEFFNIPFTRVSCFPFLYLISLAMCKSQTD